MGCFPFRCGICGGGYSQCARRRQYEKQNRKNDKRAKEESEYDDDDHHANCGGGQFCYSDDVVVRSGQHIFLNCQYTSYGSATLGRTGHTVHSQEFSEYFEGWGDVKLIADGFVCIDCHTDRRRNKYLIEVDPAATDDYEYRQKHAAFVLSNKLNIPLPVVKHHILSYLNNCVENGDKFDCLLCSVFQQSDYARERALEKRWELERQKENEERNAKKARLT